MSRITVSYECIALVYVTYFGGTGKRIILEVGVHDQSVLVVCRHLGDKPTVGGKYIVNRLEFQSGGNIVDRRF